ncbi:MAG: aspartate kinase [Bacteroidales bacterium]|nr:aspartate kinase [Bacteroidales bacterium]
MIKKVFKFGGASVKDADSVRNLKSIIEREDRDNLLIVISAMGKTTSIIEKTLKLFRDNDGHLEITALRELMCYHEDIMTDLFNGNTQHPVFDTVANIFIDLFCNLQETGFQYDYQYDQTVSFGEVLSTTIISAFLNDNGIKNTLLDARDYIITDHNFRSANIDWDESRLRIQKLNNEHNGELLITQGFIASSTKPVVTTTLGREGSDYSAAIFANLLDAKEMTVWKDVDGIRNADPKRFPSSEKIPHLSYSEATELTFYGASVLHPKTTKPLQNKNIPLKVRSFIDASLPPTIIDSCEEFIHYAPSFIVKDNQMLVTIRPRDFSFMNEQNLGILFGMLNELNIHANMIQTSALNLSICIDENLAKLNQLIDSLEQSFLIKYNIGLQLFTIRHYTEGIERQFIQGRKIFIEQRSRSTLQLVLGLDDASK